MIEAQGVDFFRGKQSVLQDVSLKINPGEMVFVLGPNGSGKSTLLKLFSGLLKPTRGKILLKGKSIDQYSPLELSRIRGVLLQDHTLNFNFKVWEVVGFGFQELSPNLQKRVIELMLRRVKMWDLRNRNYLELSGGEKQRVQLARVMAQVYGEHRQTYLLLDEPTAHLDEENQDKIMEVAKSYASEGNAVVAVSHDAALANKFADHIVVLKKAGILSATKTLQCD